MRWAGKRWVIAVLLLLAFLASLIIRLQPLKYGSFIDGFDPYFHYYVIEYLDKELHKHGVHGLLSFFNHVDKRFWYPEGRNFAESTYAGLYFTNLFIYEFIRLFGFNVYSYCVVIPAFFGALIVLPVFAIVKMYTRSNLQGLIAAFIAGLSPSFIERSSAGWFDNEPFAMLPALAGLFIILWSYRRAITAEEDGTYRVLLASTIGGLLVGYSATIWGGARFFAALVAVPIFMSVLDRRVFSSGERRSMLLLLISVAAYLSILVVPALIPRPGPSEWSTDPSTLAIVVAIFWFALNIVMRSLGFKQTQSIIISLVIILGAALAVAFSGVSGISERYMAAINPWLKASEPLVASVAEHQTTSGIRIIYSYGFLLPLSIIGVAYLLSRYRSDFLSASLGIIILAALYVAYGFNRLQIHLSYALPIAASFPLDEIVRVFLSEASNRVKNKKLKVKAILNVRRASLVFFVFFVILAAVYSVYLWSPTADRGAQIYASATVFLKHNVTDWRDALNWMRRNLPQNAIVVAWWDYGYWISVIGNKTTVIDNATLNSTKIAMVARMYMSSPSESVKILRKLHGDYVVVFVTGRRLGEFVLGGKKLLVYQTGRTYGLGGDEGKFDWMIAIGGLDRSKFIGEDGVPTRYFWYNSTIGLLMPFKPLGYLQIDRSTLRVVYLTPNKVPNSPYIQIPVYKYEIVYNSTNSRPFRLVYASPAREITSGFFAQVLVYKVIYSSG